MTGQPDTPGGRTLQELLALRRPRVVQSNRKLLTIFAILCSLVVLLTYLETSRMLIPSQVVSKGDIRSLTSGFTNDLEKDEPKEDSTWSPHLLPHLHRPRALIIGFSHCEGRAVASALSSHPDIVVNKWEVKYFTGNVSLRRYLYHMPPSLDHHVTIDVCWSCITNRAALNKIRNFNNTIRIIVILCDPISRLLSTHAKRVGSSKDSLFHTRTPSIYTYDLEQFKSQISVPFSMLNNLNAQMLTEVGDYFRHVRDLYEIFTKQQVLILEVNQFRRRFVSELTRTHHFLGVPTHRSLYGITYERSRDAMCYSFYLGLKTCLRDTAQNLTQVFSSDPGLLHALQQFYRPFNRRLFLYLDNKFLWEW